MKSQLTEKDPDAGKDWRQEEKGMTEDERVGWYHWLNRHEFEQTSGDGEGQGSLAWVCKEPNTTEQQQCIPTVLVTISRVIQNKS